MGGNDYGYYDGIYDDNTRLPLGVQHGETVKIHVNSHTQLDVFNWLRSRVYCRFVELKYDRSTQFLVVSTGTACYV